MDVETLSNRILDNDLEEFEFIHNEEDNSLTHHGVKGMKWGVRKDRDYTIKPRRRDRRYKDESDAEYKTRMTRDYQERLAKISAKSKQQSEARTERMQTRVLKSQEKQAKMQIKAAERQLRAQQKDSLKKAKMAAKEKERQDKLLASKKTKISLNKSEKSMTDQDIRDAIARYKLEQDYRNEQKKADYETSGMLKKTLIGAGVVGGGILLAVGKEVAKKQLTELGNQQVNKKFVEKGWVEDSSKKKMSQEDILNRLKKMIKDAEKEG